MDNKHIGSTLDDFLKEENIEIKRREIEKRLEKEKECQDQDYIKMTH